MKITQYDRSRIRGLLDAGTIITDAHDTVSGDPKGKLADRQKGLRVLLSVKHQLDEQYRMSLAAAGLKSFGHLILLEKTGAVK